MKKIRLRLAAIVLILAGSLASCQKENPVEIPFQEYSLAGVLCRWTYYDDNKVLIVNSIEELEKYIVCTDDAHYPEIDFSENTLLLVTGTLPQYSGTVTTVLFTRSGNKYELNATVYMGSFMMPSRWFLSILVPKLTVDAIINSIINLVEYHS